MTNQELTGQDWKTFHDLKAKANLFNLEVMYKILREEIQVRARKEVMKAYLETEEAINGL